MFTSIKNPVQNVGIFATPENMKDLQDRLADYNGNEGTVANVCAFMAWNLASKAVDQLLAHINKVGMKEMENVLKLHETLVKARTFQQEPTFDPNVSIACNDVLVECDVVLEQDMFNERYDSFQLIQDIAKQTNPNEFNRKLVVALQPFNIV